MPVIMIVDDEQLQRTQLEEMIQKIGYDYVSMKDGQEAINHLLWNKTPAPDVILLDLFMPGTDGFTVIRALRNSHASLPIIALSMPGMNRHSLQAITLGAYDYITKPASQERLEVVTANALKVRHMECELEQLRPVPQHCFAPESYSGFSEAWQRIVSRAAEEAKKNTTLVIEGEDGTGKMTLARAIHAFSPRKTRPFIVTDTAHDIDALSALLSHAHGGTLAVNHAGRAPEEFLRGLEKLYNSMSHNNIRLILCLTTQHESTSLAAIERLFNKGRANALHIPPLRERRQDIPLLAQQFIAKASYLLEKSPPSIPSLTSEALAHYSWPGNIRQLHAELFTLLLHNTGEDLPAPACCYTPDAYADPKEAAIISLVDDEGNLRSLEDIEGEVIHFALKHYNTSRTDIARMLGIGRTTLYRKVHQQSS